MENVGPYGDENRMSVAETAVTMVKAQNKNLSQTCEKLKNRHIFQSMNMHVTFELCIRIGLLPTQSFSTRADLHPVSSALPFSTRNVQSFHKSWKQSD